MSDGPTRIDQLRRKHAGNPAELTASVARHLHGGDINGLPTQDQKRLLERARMAIQN